MLKVNLFLPIGPIVQGMRKSASMAACCQEIFKEKQDIKNEAREISKISIKVTNITIRA
jgi:hypothetical protein